MNKTEILDLIEKSKITPKEAFVYYKETNDVDVRNAIAVANDGLVYFALAKYATLSCYDDLLQEGRITLLKAVEKYDINVGEFSTFATKYIRCQALTYLANINNDFYIPRWRSEINQRCDKYLRKYPKASEKEICDNLKITKQQYEEYLRLTSLSCVSLNSPVSAEEKYNGTELVDFIRSKDKNIELACYVDEIASTIKKVYWHAIRRMPKEKQEYFKKMLELKLSEDATLNRVLLAQKMGLPYDTYKKYETQFMQIFRYPKTKAKLRRNLGIPLELQDFEITQYLFSEE